MGWFVRNRINQFEGFVIVDGFIIVYGKNR